MNEPTPRGWSTGSGGSRWLLLLVLWGGPVVPAAAAEGWDRVYNAPESTLDRRYLCHWKILETALEKTCDDQRHAVMPGLAIAERLIFCWHVPETSPTNRPAD